MHFNCFILLIALIAGAAGEGKGQKVTTYEQVIQGSAVRFKMIGIPGGKFRLGSTSIHADPDERPEVEVEVSPFWIEEHEVTFEEWDAYFKDASLPQSKTIDGVTRATPQYIDLTWGMGRDNQHPTNSMSQQAAMMYCKWLYTKTGRFYRLPTEAEWEYACKAGHADPITMSALKETAWFQENSQSGFHHVMEKKPNAWGLFDMLGNLSEWTLDQYDPSGYAMLTHKDPMTVPGARYPRTTRGGSFMDLDNQLRCANRIPSDAKWNQRDPQIPKSRWWLTDGMFVGFRVVRPFKEPTQEDIQKFYGMYLK